MNATMKKFGYPETQLKKFDAWVVLLRPQQVTLGSLVLVSTEGVSSFSMLSTHAFSELQNVTQFVEKVLGQAFDYEKINYLMLMMVDPDVHFHIFPRYSVLKTFDGQDFFDHGWPGPPNLKEVNKTNEQTNTSILEKLRRI